MTIARRFQTQVGVAFESSFGSAVTPVQGIPVNDVSDQTQFEVILDEGLRGIAAKDFESIQGAGHAELSCEGFVYPEEIGYFLKLIMGGVSTGGGGPYVHTFTLGASPGSLTLEADVITGTNGGLRYKGVRVGQVAFTFGDSVLSYSAEMMGHIASKVTATNPAVTSNTPWQSWRMVATSAGITNRIVSGQLTLARPLQVIQTGEASQNARYIAVGPLEVSGSLVLAAEALTDFDNFLLHLNQSLVLTFDNAASTKSIVFTMTSCSFADGPVEVDRGDVGVMFNVPIRGIYNATDAGPVKIVLENAKTDYTT
jgi:hypothetical protein